MYTDTLCRDQDSNLGSLGHNEKYSPLYYHGIYIYVKLYINFVVTLYMHTINILYIIFINNLIFNFNNIFTKLYLLLLKLHNVLCYILYNTI